MATETVTVFGELPSPIETTDFTRSQRLREEVVDAVPSNGRNFVDLALLTPGASVSQGPDGDELNINGQRGIFNNFIVDGADFNNPFFGEQRGGQRAAFTFNQDAIGELVIVNQGAPAEFGRSAGGLHHRDHQVGHQRTGRLRPLLRPVGRDRRRVPRGPGRRKAGFRAEPVRGHLRRPARPRPGVLLPRLRPAGGRRDEADHPAGREPGEPGAAPLVPRHPLARGSSRTSSGPSAAPTTPVPSSPSWIST